MKDLLALLENWPYAIWAIGAASAFYFSVAAGSKHLSEEAKTHLSLYLQGDYRGTWAENFCTLFDHIFGPHHLSWKCIKRSAIASLLAVAALYVLLDQILGVLTVRATTTLTVWQALLIGAVVNIIPDYLSLWETRVILRAFRRVRNPLGQVAILILDLILSGLIIWAAITAFLWIMGAEPISWVEMMALFSTYAVFFYSTFLTSIWAWLYCLSSSFIKGFTKLRLHKLLAVGTAPGTSLALTGSIAVFASALALKPVITMDEAGRVALDAKLCELFPRDACTHVARLTQDQQEKLNYLSTACKGGRTDQCFKTAKDLLFFEPLETVKLFTIPCERGEAQSCTALGWMYEMARGVEQDDGQAVRLYQRGCNGGDNLGCTNLGKMYEEGLGVSQDHGRAIELYETACDDGNAQGCTSLASMYRWSVGVAKDYARAIELYEQGCDGGNTEGCVSLGYMYEAGVGVDLNQSRAAELYRDACDSEDAKACTMLGRIYENGRVNARAVEYYNKGCYGGFVKGCTRLGYMYKEGLGVKKDHVRASQFFVAACGVGDPLACVYLFGMQERAPGVDRDN